MHPKKRRPPPSESDSSDEKVRDASHGKRHRRRSREKTCKDCDQGFKYLKSHSSGCTGNMRPAVPEDDDESAASDAASDAAAAPAPAAPAAAVARIAGQLGSRTTRRMRLISTPAVLSFSSLGITKSRQSHASGRFTPHGFERMSRASPRTVRAVDKCRAQTSTPSPMPASALASARAPARAPAPASTPAPTFLPVPTRAAFGNAPCMDMHYSRVLEGLRAFEAAIALVVLNRGCKLEPPSRVIAPPPAPWVQPRLYHGASLPMGRSCPRTSTLPSQSSDTFGARVAPSRTSTATPNGFMAMPETICTPSAS